MAIVLTNTEIQIGAKNLPHRKKKYLCIVNGNRLTAYATFTNEKMADEFMKELANFIGAERELCDAD